MLYACHEKYEEIIIVSRIVKLSKTSENKLSTYLNNIKDIVYDEFDHFSKYFLDLVRNDVKMIKDVKQKDIVDFYINECNKILYSFSIERSDEFFEQLKSNTRLKLANKYTSNKLFDNTIDIYFNEVKREYILHPMGESDDLEFLPENRDVFIKNNLKLVIECAKRYRGLGIEFEDLIQAGNIGLLTAYEKFDQNRANLRFAILDDIDNNNSERFEYEDACEIIRTNFKYPKKLDKTIEKIPEDGFFSKDEFREWTKKNIDKASFSSIGFIWVRAMILAEINNMATIIKVPKANAELSNKLTLIRLDSINPYTDDNHTDNELYDVANDEFASNDEHIENMERQNVFKELVSKLILKLNNQQRRIIKKRFGIDTPYSLSLSEIAESENITTNKVKNIIQQSLSIISDNIPELDKELMKELL